MVLLWSWVFALSAQPADTIVQLPTALIQPTTDLRGTELGGRTFASDSSTLRGYDRLDLAELLRRETGIYVKSYGGGSLATISVRGAAASQTGVLWNGLPLQSPTLGLLDLALLPAAFTDELRVHYGGHSAQWGSGNVGGMLQLDNRAPSSEQLGITVQTSAGSFGAFGTLADLKWGSTQWRGRTRVLYDGAQNDFSYVLNDRTQRQNNARMRRAGLLQEVYYQIAPNDQLALRYWYQDVERQIPPLTTQTFSRAHQRDYSHRFAAERCWLTDRHHTILRVGLFRDFNHYWDTFDNFLPNDFWQIAATAQRRWTVSDQHQWQLGLDQLYVNANSNGYVKPYDRWQSAVFGQYRGRPTDWLTWQFSVRQELLDGRFLPVVPAWSGEAQLSKACTYSIRISRNYRLPALNDLYWNGGGNPDLLPESGWSQETGVRWRQRSSNWQWQISTTGFHRLMNNWIRWSPTTQGGLWRATNLLRVRSYGVETRAEVTRTLARGHLQLRAGYDRIRSYSEVDVTLPVLRRGEQLAYVPEHQALAAVQLQWSLMDATYQHRYVGLVAGANVAEIEPYHLGFFTFAYQLSLRRGQTRVFAQVDNIWGADYRVVERRPMPGRSWQVGLRWNWN